MKEIEGELEGKKEGRGCRIRENKSKKY